MFGIGGLRRTDLTTLAGNRALPVVDDVHQATGFIVDLFRSVFGGSVGGEGRLLDQLQGRVLGELFLDARFQIGDPELENVHRQDELRSKSLLLFKSA